MTEQNILFVCTGNICRSPMAEYMLRAGLDGSGGWIVASAGTMAAAGIPASGQAIDILAGKGIDLTPHRSRPLDRYIVEASSVIVAMTAGHRDYVSRMFPESASKTFLLKSFDGSEGGGDVADPIGASMETYRYVYNEIDNALPGLVEFLGKLREGL